ncbi:MULTISPECIES: hypothetical protein [Burkholderia cepacia complex]|uniref:Uncharacterized protein n=1 Tax=Burkholderia multivorans TaxID=87883 RepID=A0AB37AZB4_9BURK|nr:MULTISPECIES: hypothetical protein [Burkholderia cepacia complex]MBJ9625252.1 hypothetical protein [Burkholderia multivorans]MBU9486689.1 hypothetical protein [Burkholderia multivorans]MBU9546578.1 hypothetical protein [Burkholderia multivorans]MBY4754869.1 hypothetical protein [Burkholderia dolosa]PRE49538.1 hypothetical protein C6P97_12620 [Burkholderia multivorans]
MSLITTYARARFLAFAQQRWIADQHAAQDTNKFCALFAGHPAPMQFKTDGAWRLSYLGFRSERIFHPADAQRAAPASMRDVLARMPALVEGAPRRSATGGRA